MPKAFVYSLLTACEKAVENLVKSFAQTFNLITSSTMGLLEISQTTTLVSFLSPVCPQGQRVFTQPIIANFHLFGRYFYSFSPTHIDANELNKGL